MRSIPDPGFADDDGSADAVLVEALTAYAAGTGTHSSALALISASRVVVPVVAVLGEVEVDADGLAHDKSSDMAAVLLQGADGRHALLAFTSIATLTAWDPEARPVPVPVSQAAQAAVQEEAAALVVDVAGPVTFVVEGEDLAALARGWTLARVGDRLAWIGSRARSGDYPPAE